MRWITSVVLVAAIALGGCGDDDGATPRLTVSAASSLKTAFEDYASSFNTADVRFSFAGSDELAAQIRQGAKPDVYAAANTKLPEELAAEGEVEQPGVFAANRLVMAVPKGATGVRSLGDLAGSDVNLVIGDADVPVGLYTREVLDRLPGREREAILGNVRSEEPDVLGIVGKLAQGAADAGFLYITDVAANEGELEAIEPPEELRPSVQYGIAVVRGSDHQQEAQAFIDGLSKGAGLTALQEAGFDPPPQQ